MSSDFLVCSLHSLVEVLAYELYTKHGNQVLLGVGSVSEICE